MSLHSAGTQETPATQPRQTFKGHTDILLGVIHIPEKQRIITCSLDGSLRLWNTESGLQLGNDWKDGKSRVSTIALSPDRKTVASGSSDYAVKLWDVDTGKVITKWTGHSQRVWSVCWSRDGQRMTSGSSDGTVRVWDVESGETIPRPIHTGHQVVYAVVYSPDETMIASGGSDKLIKIWDAKTFEPVTTLKGHTDRVNCLTWTTDGKTLFSGSGDNSIRRWSTTTWKQIAILTGHSSTIKAVAISPNERILASASYDHTVRLWNLENDQSISSPLQHVHIVGSVSFSADGGLLATACDDYNAYTWHVAAILREAGFDDLLLHPALPANATRRLTKPLNNARSLPLGFFDDTRAGDHIHAPSARPHSPSSAPQSSTLRPRTLLDHFSSLFAHPHSGVRNAPSHGRPTSSFRSTLANFFRHHHSDNERPLPEVVEVPCVRGNPRNVHVRENSKHVTDPSNIIMLTVDGPSQPPNHSQSNANASGQNPLLQSQHPVNPTLAAAAAPATTSATEAPFNPESDVVLIRQAGCWTHLLLSLGCISPARHH